MLTESTEFINSILPSMLSFVNQSLSRCKALKPQVKDLKKTKIDHSGHNH